MEEVILQGGRSTDSVVKIGNTVHRTQNENSEFVHKLLKLLEEKKYPYSPRFLGIDLEGREILTFIPGEISTDIVWTNELLKKVVLMLRQFHDATENSNLVEPGKVVCHRDLAPWNTLMLNNEPVGFIDFDGASGGERVEDLAYFLWTFLDLGEPIDPNIQADRIKYLCDIYGYSDGDKIPDAIIHQQQIILELRKDLSIKAKTQEERDFSKRRIKLIEKAIEWIKDNSEVIKGRFKI